MRQSAGAGKDRRPSAYSRGYDRHWTKARNAFIALHPLCVKCRVQGKVVKATVVDHIIPHKGDKVLFWDRENWQGLCKQHHDSTKQKEERTGIAIGVDVDGRPLDPKHIWNKTKGGGC